MPANAARKLHCAVSTTAFRRQPIESVIAKAIENDLALEFSSGLPYRRDMEEIFAKAKVTRLPHNYFPAPEKPFVLNLGSANEEIRRTSIDHCRKGLGLAAAAGAPFFSVHAGFCLDPAPEELGVRLKMKQSAPREAHWKLFVDSVKELCREAERLGVRFVVENNVVAAVNCLPDRTAPLLCADAGENERLLREVSSPALGLLLDTGHLKVSSGTLGFSADDYVERLKNHIIALHHSDNDGVEDTNNACAEDYWFLAHMKSFRHAWHILEVHDQTVEQVKHQFRLFHEAAFAENV